MPSLCGASRPGTRVISSLRARHSFNLSHNEGLGRAGRTHPAPGFRGAPALPESTLGCCWCRCEPPPPPSGQAGGDGRGGSRGSGGKVGEPGPQHSWVRVCTVVWVRAGGVPPWPEGPLRLPGTHSPPPSTRAGLAQGGCCHGAVEWKWGSGKAQDPPPPISHPSLLGAGRGWWSRAWGGGPWVIPDSVGQVGTHGSPGCGWVDVGLFFLPFPPVRGSQRAGGWQQRQYLTEGAGMGVLMSNGAEPEPPWRGAGFPL